MKLGVLGWILGDLTDVDYRKVRWLTEQGFHGSGAHLTVPAETVSATTAATVRALFDDHPLDLFQLWGPYPCIISADESARRAGVAGARALVKLAARMGVPGTGVRPTSLNPRGDWWPHRDNHSAETEERFVRSLREILETAHDYGVTIILEMHQLTVLDSAQRIRRVIERVESDRVKVNLDTVNFVTDLRTAFNPAPMINEMFDVLGPYVDTVHVKDFYLEDRFVLHIAETLPGTGIMDLDTVLRRTQALLPDGYAVIEHLPPNLIPVAAKNLAERIRALGLPLG